MTKTAVIFGANSDIAKSAIQLLEGQYHIVAVGRDTIDLDDPTSDMRIGMVLTMAEPDVIVNCAGVFDGDNTLDYDTVFNVNLKSNWSVINYYIKNPPAKDVRFVMIGSSAYKQGRKNFILYSASKAALFNVWQGASEFVSDNLKLGLINPVHVHTKMVAHRPHPNPDICLEPIDVAREIMNLCTMTQSRYVDMDYKIKETV
jgi:NAD(P)-dependent dehydrogenase (short-subunit alcohol dehydrogenase family)